MGSEHIRRYLCSKNVFSLSVSSQWATQPASSIHTEEAGQRKEWSVREDLWQGGLLQNTASFVPGQTPRLGPAARTQQELLPGPLLWRENSTKPKRGVVIRGGGGLLPAGHGHGEPETRLHCAALPHSEFPGTALSLRAGERVPLLRGMESDVVWS